MLEARLLEANDAKLSIIQWLYARRLHFNSAAEADKDSATFFADLDDDTIVPVVMGESFPAPVGGTTNVQSFDKVKLEASKERVNKEYRSAYLDYMDRERIHREFEDGKTFNGLEYMVDLGGEIKWYSSAYMTKRDPDTGHLVLYLFVLQVDEYRKTLEELDRMAHQDPMTGLLNKLSTQNAIDKASRSASGYLLMLDLDSFKLVNDIYGHNVGDKVIIGFSQIIRSAVRGKDLAGRIGGDEFAVFLNGGLSEEQIREKTRYINDRMIAFAKALLGEDMDIPLGVSVGAVKCPEFGTDFMTLYQNADKALYEVKQNGKGSCAFYHEALTVENGSAKNDIMTAFRERNHRKGGFETSEDNFRLIFQYLDRAASQYVLNTRFIQLTMTNDTATKEEFENAMIQLVNVLCSSLRESDAVSRHGRNQVNILLFDIEKSDSDTVVKRLIGRWDALGLVGYELSSISEWL